jgi:hypothetical protein
MKTPQSNAQDISVGVGDHYCIALAHATDTATPTYATKLAQPGVAATSCN